MTIALGATGIAYLVVPAVPLGIVGIQEDATSEFLLRTQGVPLVACGVLVGAIAARGSAFLVGVGLLVAAAYLIVSSLIDVAAFLAGIVGLVSVPSAIVRILAGVVCLVVLRRAWRGVRAAADERAGSSPAADSPVAEPVTGVEEP
jgi:hypothetical protein